MLPPLNVSIRYKDKGDLKVYGSFTNTEPNEKDFYKFDENPSTIEVLGSRGAFKSKQYYLSFFSKKGIKIVATVYFT